MTESIFVDDCCGGGMKPKSLLGMVLLLIVVLLVIYLVLSYSYKWFPFEEKPNAAATSQPTN